MHARRLAASLALALASPAASHAQERATYTLEQAAAGQAAYAESCAECHRHDMTGSFEAPALVGPAFLSFWGGRPVEELTDMASYMPPDAERSLGEETYTSIVAYILSRNGVPAGGAPLTFASTAPLEAATGTPVDPAAAAPAGRGGGGRGAAGLGGRGGPPPGGTDTYAAVSDFRPVSDAELVDPAPGVRSASTASCGSSTAPRESSSATRRRSTRTCSRSSTPTGA